LCRASSEGANLSLQPTEIETHNDIRSALEKVALVSEVPIFCSAFCIITACLLGSYHTMFSSRADLDGQIGSSKRHHTKHTTAYTYTLK